MNLVNNNNPQSQQHVLPVLEFAAKDTHYNVKKAAFEDDSLIKIGMDAVINRKLVLLEIKVGKEVRAAIAINNSASHDYKKPSAVPKPTAVHEHDSQTTPWTIEDRVQHCTVKIDFALVATTKLRYNNTSNECEGVSFFDTNDQCIAVSYFISPIKCSVVSVNDSVGTCRQILVIGVLTADMEFLGTFFGLQGGWPTFPCINCLVKLKDMALVYQGNVSFQERTIEMFKKDHATYQEKFESKSLTEQKKPKAKSKVTIGDTHSVDKPSLSYYQLECVTKASMHVVLGFTKDQIFEWTKKGLRTLEKIVAADINNGINNGNDAPVEFVETIQAAYDNVLVYETFLKKHLEEEVDVMQLEMNNMLKQLIEEAERHLDNPYLNPAQTAYYTAQRDNCQQQLVNTNTNNTNSNTNTNSNNDRNNIITYKMQVMEQVYITKETKQELEMFLKNHEGYAARVVIAALKKFGVDIQVYHNGSIIGNHCMIYAERGDSIMTAIEQGMVSKMRTTQHKTYLTKFCSQMKEMIGIWFELQKVMKSTGLQSDETIDQFEVNMNRLRDFIYKFVVSDPPIPGTGIKLPASLKTHIMFGQHLVKQLRQWGTLGGLDEQNTESTHAVWNLLMSRFGACRGVYKKRLVIEQFLFDRASFVQAYIHDLKEGTKRKKGPRYGMSKNNTVPATNDTEEPDDDDDAIEDIPLKELQSSINSSETLHPYLVRQEVEEGEEQPPIFNTHVSICPHCAKAVLKFAIDIHIHEVHSGGIVEEADGVQ